MRVTEAEILAAMTPAGGWTRETLEGWGVSWPPVKGWKERLIGAQSYVPPPKRWLGRVRAISRAELSVWYWETDTAIAEIIEAYAPGRHTNEISRLAGKAVLIDGRGEREKCKHCSLTVYASSRSEAATQVRSKDDVGPNFKFRGFTCHRCKDAERAAREQEWREQSAGRARRTRELATMPYRDYLQTPEWQATRKTALSRAKFRCQTCADGGTLHVHHRTYVRRGQEWASDLIVLCSSCHELFHQNARLAEGGRAA